MSKKVPEIRFKEFSGEWEEKQLKDVVSYFKGFAFKSKDYTYSGRRIVRVSDMGFDYIKETNQAVYLKEEEAKKYTKWTLQEDDLIVTTVGSKPPMYDSLVGRTIVVKYKDKGFLLNQNAVCLRANKNIYQKFLNILFKRRGYITFVESIIRGNANQGSITLENLFKYKLYIPFLPEQKKIADTFNSLDNLITAHNKKLELLKEYKKGLMQKLFPKDGVKVPEIRFKEFSGKWEEKRLGDIGITYNGLSGKTSKDFNQGENYYITYKTIFDNSKIDITKLEKVKINKNEKQNSVKFGDIFFTISSEISEEIAMSSVLLDSIQNVYLNSFCFGFRINEFKILNPYFARYYFRSLEIRKKLIKLAQGSTRFNISKNNFTKIKILIPKSHKEQQKIADTLSSLDNLIEAQTKKIETLKKHKKGLMQKMFVSGDD